MLALMVGSAVAVAAALVLVPWLLTMWRWRRLPGRVPWPILGNLPAVQAAGSLHQYAWALQQELAPKTKVTRVQIGSITFVCVGDAAAARGIQLKLNSRQMPLSSIASGKPDDDQLFNPEGLVFVPMGDHWRRLRNAWQPAFAAGSLAGYGGLMDRCAGQLVAVLEEAADEGRPVDIHRELGNMTLDVVGTTAMGTDFHALPRPSAGGGGASQDPAGAALAGACRTLFDASTSMRGSRYQLLMLLAPPLRPLWLWLARVAPDRRLKEVRAASATLRATSLGLIAVWKSQHAQQGGGARSGDAGKAPGAKKGRSGIRSAVAPGSFLDLLLEACSTGASDADLSDMQVKAQANTFILAGYETTANALAFCVYCLAAHPARQAKMLEELDDWTARHPGGSLEGAELPYLEATISEAMRLYPPAPFTSRRIERPEGFTLPGSGVHLPQGTPIMLAPCNYHRDPDYWPRGQEFVPERWLPGNERALGPRTPDAYTPFGAGARMCVGYRFANLEAKLALARLYQRLTFELEPGQVPLETMTAITMGPKHGVMVRPVRRGTAPPIAVQ